LGAVLLSFVFLPEGGRLFFAIIELCFMAQATSELCDRWQ
jgi:hypothetical protein